MALRRFLHEKVFTKYLLLTNVLVCGSLDGLGDFLEQRREQMQPHNWPRTARMAAFGCIEAPVGHYWFQILERYLPGKQLAAVSKKVMLDMVLMGPIEVVTFYVAMCAMEGKSRKNIWKELKEKFLLTYELDWVVWPPAQAINFFFVPLRFRVIYCNCIAVLWSMVLSYLKHHDIEQSPQRHV